MSIMRIPQVLTEMGLGRSSFYAGVADGVITRPVKIGQRAAGLPSEEVAAMNRARIAGQTVEQQRELVRKLEAARLAAVAEVAA